MQAMESLEVQLLLLELADTYARIPQLYRDIFLEYIQDELVVSYDIELYGEMIDVLVQGLYQYRERCREDEVSKRRFIADFAERLAILESFLDGEQVNPQQSLSRLLESIVVYAREVSGSIQYDQEAVGRLGGYESDIGEAGGSDGDIEMGECEE